MTDPDPSGGNGAARVLLSEAINAVLDVVEDCAGTLAAARLETCVDALRNASGERKQ